MKSKKIKILVVNPSISLGGGNTISNSLILGLDKERLETLSFFPEKGISTGQIEKVVKIILPPKTDFFSITRFLRNFVKETKIDIIHCHGTRAAFWGRLAVIGLKNKPKVIYTLHGLHIIHKPFFLKWPLVFIERFLDNWTDVLVCVSESDKKLVVHYKTISPEKIKVIKNGIDIEKFQVNLDSVAKTKKELGIENDFVLCSIGRLHPPKDFSTILRALKLIIPQSKNIKLLIIGDGPLRKELEKETESLELKDYVKFLGWREDISILTNLSNIAILSSNWEALGLVCLEAGACQKPIIASDVEGIREAVIDGKTGYLFELGSEKDLADKILKLYRDEDLRKGIGESGYVFVSENFSKARMIEEYQNLYQSIL